jgi:Acetyltransferase (GNAT) domain
VTSIDDVEIRDFRPGDGAGIVALLNEVFSDGDDRFEPRTVAHWEWVYEQNPAGRQIIVAQDPGGRIVGHYACIPYKTVVRGEETLCGQGVDSMVAVDYRRGLKTEGLFVKTARRYFEKYGVPEQNAYGYGFPNRKAFRIGVRVLNYVPVHSPVPTIARNLFDKPDDRDVESGSDTVGEVLPIERFGEDADELWRRLRPEIEMGTVRDAAFLNWRYIDCPFAPHGAFGLFDAGGALRGAYVSRADWTGPPILALSEFLVPGGDPDAAVRLLAHAVRHARETGQQRVEVWLPPTHALFGVVTSHGFVPEESPFHLCIKIYDPSLQPDWVRSNWYFSIGDTDVF